MQEFQRPDGSTLREFFTDDERKRGKMDRRRKELEAQGHKFVRVAYVSKSQSVYEPHQGKQEMARRVRQMERAAEKQAKRLAAETC